jgi:hypothetical protein
LVIRWWQQPTSQQVLQHQQQQQQLAMHYQTVPMAPHAYGHHPQSPASPDALLYAQQVSIENVSTWRDDVDR